MKKTTLRMENGKKYHGSLTCLAWINVDSPTTTMEWNGMEDLSFLITFTNHNASTLELPIYSRQVHRNSLTLFQAVRRSVHAPALCDTHAFSPQTLIFHMASGPPVLPQTIAPCHGYI